ncbi:putative endonuclease [Geothermobacter ehrlichii]|uniref:UPF0102 protein EDC39_11525 n=1 Tax=Geothermobacter ehrlichii TaxID=213224 RepID=A0A5D3WIK4_9BACT|nr:YraN family protein [Geothermobacter ehrlichii]TYO96079.1 putative endonuclease [Geothermobacter ehrlichii]
MSPHERQTLGSWGERMAAAYLRQKGLRILCTNYRTPVGEIDLVARNRRHLVFVEVKTRRGTGYGSPQEAVGSRKQRQIIRAAQWYINDRGASGLQPRFDVVAVLRFGDGARIEHIENAFGLPA